MREIKNAKIKSTMLGNEDHGILTCFLHLDYSGSGQGFGGYCFDSPVGLGGDFKGRIGTAYGMEFIRKIIETLEVEKWEDLPGTFCRSDCEHSKIHRIGHITKDKWFDPATDLAQFLTKEEAA